MLPDSAPETLDEAIGQNQPREILKVLVESSLRSNTPVSPFVLAGPPGYGKTLLARLTAKYRGEGIRCVEMVASHLQRPEQLVEQLLGLHENEFLFLDEIHCLGRLEELLYPILQGDLSVPVFNDTFNDLMRSLGASSQSERAHAQVAPFTLVGATTELGSLSPPLRSRLRVIQLYPYTQDELVQIVQTTADRLSFQLPKEAAHEIAKRSRNTARTAVSHLKWIMEYTLAKQCTLCVHVIDDAFRLMGICHNGLTEMDRQYLRYLAGANGHVGIGTMAIALNESIDTLQQTVEPYLIQQGYIRRTTRGRIAEPKAHEALEVAV